MTTEVEQNKYVDYPIPKTTVKTGDDAEFASIKLLEGCGTGKLLTSNDIGRGEWGVTLAEPGNIGETTPGFIRSLNREVFIVSSRALTALECSGTIISNYGMTDADLVGTLPTCSAGLGFICILPAVRARYFKFRAGSTDKIYLDGTAGADNGYVGVESGYATGAAISFIVFKASDGNYDWFATGIFGSWIAS